MGNDLQDFLFMENGSSVSLQDIPGIPFASFREKVLLLMQENRLEAFFALPEKEKGFSLFILLGSPAKKGFLVAKSTVMDSFESFTSSHAAFNRFEREIMEKYPALSIQGHPNAKPLRFPGKNEETGVMDYFRMKGDAVHEVAVGPVHAGVIEPGHFRFQCMGEDVYSLEISLGYQHRDLENMLVNGPDAKSIHLIETASGDSSIAAAINYSRIMETLSGVKVEEDAETARQVALELERCANHIGDLGALAGDVAFLPTASFCGRIRGEYLNMTAELCGNRFGRNFVVPGGIRYSLDREMAQKILPWLKKVSKELWKALALMFNAPTCLDRFEHTGTVPLETAKELGLTGMAARASGLQCDARKDFPVKGVISAESVFEDQNPFEGNGDVYSRAILRFRELRKSHEFLFRQLTEIQNTRTATGEQLSLQKEKLAVSVTEAWRGELCHVAVTDTEGRFRLYKIVDPSFHNWEGLAMALRNEQISHFPICNKSFNLSYCGHDL
ncbi:MAG: hydrogenase [Lentisphaeria bacterium]|nr:hydrogenase [Lentisphaeria bacterium]